MKVIIKESDKPDTATEFINGHIYAPASNWAPDPPVYLLKTAAGLVALPSCKTVFGTRECDPEKWIDVTDRAELVIRER